MKPICYMSLLLVAFAAAACSKDDTGDPNPGPGTPNNPPAGQQISLVYPKEVVDLNPCCISFSWSAGKAGNFRFQLSPNANFSGALLDSVLTDTVLVYSPQLLPNTTYYWRVSDSSAQQATTFRTKDVLAGFTGNYPNAQVRRYHWSGVNGIFGDTAYTASINISQSGSTAYFQHPAEGIDRTLEYWMVQNVPNAIRYRTSVNLAGSNNYAYVDLYYLTDSVVVQNSAGGLGGGTRWFYRTRQE